MCKVNCVLEWNYSSQKELFKAEIFGIMNGIMYLVFSFGLPIIIVYLFNLSFWPVIIVWFSILLTITIFAFFTA